MEASTDSALELEMLGPDRQGDAEAVWLELEDTVSEVPLAVSWDWTRSWLDHYRDCVRHRFAVARTADGSARGVALVCERAKRRGPISLRRVYLGTAGEPEDDCVCVQRNALLAAPGWHEPVARALLELRAEEGWDELELSGFDPDFAGAFLAADPSLRVSESPSRKTDLREMGGGLEAILQAKRSRTRQKLRRQLRFYDDLQTDFPLIDAGAKLAIFDELCELHQRRWQASQGGEAMPRVLRFHRDLVRRAPDETLLFRTRNGGDTLACAYALCDRGEAVGYLAAFHPPADKRMSPGLITHLLFAAELGRAGYDAYDLSTGAADYKRTLTTGEGRLVRVRGSRRRAQLLDPRWRHAPV